MGWSKLVDMALTPEEQADYGMPTAVGAGDAPQYPYALKVAFSEAELEKLGLDVADASVGDLIDMRCFGTITSISQNQKADGTSCCRVEIQIEKVAMESEMDEDEG